MEHIIIFLSSYTHICRFLNIDEDCFDDYGALLFVMILRGFCVDCSRAA